MFEYQKQDNLTGTSKNDINTGAAITGAQRYTVLMVAVYERIMAFMVLRICGIMLFERSLHEIEMCAPGKAVVILYTAQGLFHFHG